MDAEFHEEQKLRNEVIYLHSLWHQGPPLTANPPTESVSANLNVLFGNNNTQGSLWQQSHLNPRPTARPAYPNPYDNGRNCQYGYSFHERKRKDRGVLDTPNVLSSQSEPVPSWYSGPDWPCPALESRASKVSRIMSEEERSRHIAWEMQYKAFDSCREFFRKRVSSAASDSDSDGAFADEDDDDMDDDVSEDCEEYKFFLNVFVEDYELRSYYEENYKCGEFFCLVCGGTGKKNAKKRFKDAIGLVQHSLTISNTLKRRAHRAFGKVISKVLGWDVDRLPAIVLRGDTLGQLLKMTQYEAEGEQKEFADNGKNNVEILHVPVNHYSESCEETSNQVQFCKDYTETVDGSCNTENNDQKIPNSEEDKESEEKVGKKRSEDDLKESLDYIDESIVYVNDIGGAVEQGPSTVNQTSIEPMLSEVASKMSEDQKESLDVLEECIVSVNDIDKAVEQGVSAVNQTSNVHTLCEDSMKKKHIENDTEKDGVNNKVSKIEVGYKRSEDDPNENLDVLSECIVSANNVGDAVGQGASAVNQASNELMLSKVGHKIREDDPKESLDVLHKCIVSVNEIGGADEQEASAVSQISIKPMHSEFGNKTSEVYPKESLDVPYKCIMYVNDIDGAFQQEASAVNQNSDEPMISEVRKKTSEGDPKESLDVLDESNVSVNDIGAAVEQEASGVNQTSNEPMLCEDSLEDSHSKNDTDNAGINNEVQIIENLNQSPAIESKWPCEMSSDNMSSTSGWPATKPHLTFPKYIISPEEQANAAAQQMQQKVLASCKAFFAGNLSSEIDEDDDDTESSEDEEEMDNHNRSEACEEFKFLLKLFTEEDEIRRYYENHSKEGNFYCLVCGGIGKKAWKTFKGCIGLLQHANSILKTEKRRAHRSYVQVICKLLGWDFDRLPAIVLKGEPLGISLAKSSTENRELS